MARKDMIMATQEELRKLHVIRKLLDKLIKQKEAAEVLDLTTRQIRRITERVREEGDRGIIHKSRGKVSNRALSFKAKVLRLFETKYGDFGPTLACEKLFEIDKLKLSDETLRRWLISAGISYPSREKRPHRAWRERKRHFGEMVQMDGSHHDWFEGRGPKCVLMAYIDDATGRPYARFYSHEGAIPALDSFKRYITRYGIPQSVYLDRHSTYKSTQKEMTFLEELENKRPETQFQRALKELNVSIHYAYSPQAKGRIERLFRTFQDRLIKEMRLKGIKTMEEGNRLLRSYLPAYAKRYGVKAADEENLHREIPKDLDLKRIFSLKTERALRNDHTVQHEKKLYQVLDQTNAKVVTVLEGLSGSLELYAAGKRLRVKEIKARPQRETVKVKKAFKLKRRINPSAAHPWRKSYKTLLLTAA